jgi:hypothetical protein
VEYSVVGRTGLTGKHAESQFVSISEKTQMVLFQAGEADAGYYTGYLTKRTISGLYAQEMGGAVLLLERGYLTRSIMALRNRGADRYYGESSPYDELTPKTMQYLTFRQALADTVNFAKNVKFPFDTTGKSNADKAVRTSV